MVRRVLVAGSLALALAGCGSTSPSPASSGKPPASAAGAPAATRTTQRATPNPYAWTRTDPLQIEEPSGFMVIHHDAYGSPTVDCAPCHPAIDTTMTGIVDGPSGLVAVGWIFQGFHGAVWQSSDASRWTLAGDFPELTILQGVAAGRERYVAVGLDGKGATAWSSTDGRTWQRPTSNEAFAASPLRAMSVTAWSGGFAAAGFEGAEFGSAKAAFWVSADGQTWRRAPDSQGLHDARAWSITAGGPGLVAVGTPGPADHPGPAVIWTSPDGLQWTRVADDPVFHDARIRVVTSARGLGSSSEGQLVAAGENLAGTTGVIWTSQDGLHWTRAPDNPVFGGPGTQLRIYAALAGGPGVVVAGTINTGIQYGDAVVWTSPDGTTWTKQPYGPEFNDGEITALTAAGSRLVAVGDRGAPDAYQATVWTSPDGWAR